MSIDVMKQALEAFEWNYNTDLDNIPVCEQWAKMLKTNITALRAAIEQAQEPVAWYLPSPDGDDSIFRDHRTVMACTGNKWEGFKPLYPSPRQWQGLTGEEIEQCCYEAFSKAADHPQTWKWTEAFARAIEAKLKEKNT